ncbi:putative f420-dependent NADP [Rosellinia necatrix]|uniref:Putative f420-dependent NADP n=1 Tax=Rosellinia necatrix TaxID=77044 RepID=A0A1W2TWE5_ROSNE|nr:putative f420-dependent NADP [Rosellinia necatrix]
MRVAIAGYGDLTRYICEEFIKAGHVLVILTRTYKPQLESQSVTQAITDYTLSSLRSPLADCGVLISTISDFSSAYTSVHRSLILACHESPKCKRFIPAEFATNIKTYPDQPGFYYAPHEPIREMLRSQTDIEWTLVCIGWLADYFLPTKNRYIKDIDEFHPMNWTGENIVIPGTGNEPVDFTWARDAVRGLVALVGAPQGSWEPYTFMSGERSCWNDAVNRIRQKHRPDAPIEHVSLHATVEMIKKAKDENTLILADYYLLSISQACANPPDMVRAHREKYFPGVNFRTLESGMAHMDKYPDSIL